MLPSCSSPGVLASGSLSVSGNVGYLAVLPIAFLVPPTTLHISSAAPAPHLAVDADGEDASIAQGFPTPAQPVVKLLAWLLPPRCTPTGRQAHQAPGARVQLPAAAQTPAGPRPWAASAGATTPTPPPGPGPGHSPEPHSHPTPPPSPLTPGPRDSRAWRHRGNRGAQTPWGNRTRGLGPDMLYGSAGQ